MGQIRDATLAEGLNLPQGIDVMCDFEQVYKIYLVCLFICLFVYIFVCVVFIDAILP